MDDLLELLRAVKDVVGHGNVRWDVDPETKEIRLYTGLTARDKDGKVMNNGGGLTLRQTDATVELEEMGH